MGKFQRKIFHVILLVIPIVSSPNAFSQTPSTNSPWSSVVMIGASASAGFVITEPFGGTNTLKCRLSYYFDAAITPPHEPVKNLANALFFLQPEPSGRGQIEQALKLRPSLVVGADFLFWFCYGQGTNDEQRAERFENGLKLLEAIRCPLVLGDIPDASFATNTGIISPAQVPSAAAMTAANARLKTWASVHPQVVLVPVSALMRTAMSNQSLTIHGQTLPAGTTRANLQPDMLHPNPHGAAMLALGILDTLVSKRPEFPASDVRWSIPEVLRLGSESALPKPALARPASGSSAIPAK